MPYRSAKGLFLDPEAKLQNEALTALEASRRGKNHGDLAPCGRSFNTSKRKKRILRLLNPTGGK